jgi:hypothetical protein
MMKKLLLCLILLVFSCSKGIRVNLDKHLQPTGVEIWGHKIIYTAFFPDVTIENGDPNTFGVQWNIGRYYEDENLIIVLYDNPNLIAHEFGHFLGYFHSDNSNSIMYPKIDRKKDLYSYVEFSDQ